MPVIEAQYFGKPAFLAKATSLPEVGGSVAYYFDNFEPAHMQQVFNDGMKDWAANNREAAIIEHASQFSWENSASKYLALYKELLKTI